MSVVESPSREPGLVEWGATRTDQPPEPEPLASFVVPVHNDEAYVDEALRSVRAQTVKRIEIIVVDDGSTDGSLAIAQRHASEDPRVRVIVQGHRGAAEARNLGIQLARANWVALQDADDVSLPTRLERQLAFLNAHPDVAALGTYGWRIGPSGRRVSVLNLGPRDYEHLDRIRARSEGVWLQTGSTVLSRDLVLREGGFRSDLGVADDFELWTNLAAEHSVLALPERLYEYRIHADSITMSRFFEQMRQTLRVQVNAARRRSGQPELDLAAFRQWYSSRRLPERLRYAAECRSRYCYRVGAVQLISGRPRGVIWLAGSWVLAPNVPLARLRRQVWPLMAEQIRSRLPPAPGPRRS